MECVPDLAFLQMAATHSDMFNKMMWHSAAAASGGSAANSGSSGTGSTTGSSSSGSANDGTRGSGNTNAGGGGGNQSPAITGNNSNSSTMKQRKTNFTSREVEALLAAVADRKDTVLFGVAGGIGWARAWHEVAQHVSSVEGIHRSESDVRKKWTYLKWEAKNTSKPGRDPTSRAVLEILTSREGSGQQPANSLLEQLLVPGGGSAGSPSSPGSVPIAPKKLSSIVASTSSMPSTLPSSTPVPPPPPPEVCLRWNSYHSNMQATFPTLLNNEQFVDVTLACEGRSIKCHKVMLSACSSYFEELLSQNPCQHPIVFMRDLKFWEVQALVEFMYSGEVNVAQEKLPSLLAAAEALQIKGLTGPTQTPVPQDESDYIATHESEDTPLSQSAHKRVRKRKSTNPMAYPSRQSQPSPKQMPMMHPIVQLSNPTSSSSPSVSGSVVGGGISTQPHSLTSSPNRKDSTSSSSSYHPPIKIKKERESTPPLALIKEEPLDLGKDSMETGSNNGHDLSNASSYHASISYERSHYSGRTMANKAQNGLSDEEDRSSTHSNQSDYSKSPIEEKPDPGDDTSDV